MAQESDSRDLDKVIVRLPHGMRDQLKAEAEVAKRSMNAEIVSRLERSFRRESALRAIVSVGLGVETYVPPANGRATGLSASVKKAMKARLSAYVDALPDAPETTISDEEFAELSAMVDRYKPTKGGRKR